MVQQWAGNAVSMLIMTKRYHPSLSCKDVIVKELNHFKDIVILLLYWESIYYRQG